MNGFVRLHRSVYQHAAFRDFSEASAFIWLFAHAAWRPTAVRYKDRVIKLQRGQLAISIRDLARKLETDTGVVRRFVERLKNQHMIRTANDTGVTVITICNYDKFQVLIGADDTPNDTPNDTAPTQHRHSTDTQNNKEKKEKKEKKRDDDAREDDPESIRERVCERHGFDESKNPTWAFAHDINIWLRSGATAEDIEHAIALLMARLARRGGDQPNSWQYFAQAVANARATREAGLPDGEVQTATDPRGDNVIDWPEVRRRLREGWD